MKFIVLDQGSISPAYFSQPAIKYLLSQGHSVEILHSFDAQKCSEADVVWSEWCNDIAFQAAESGLCKRLVLRMRGYDLWYPLDKLAWVNVDALLYESQSLQDMAEERFPFLKGRGKVLPAGIQLDKFPFKDRSPFQGQGRARIRNGNVIAMVARVISDKGYQLALEWARQNPKYALHMTMLGVESNPRLVRYLRHSAPANVTLYEGVDTAVWLESIQANFLLLPSIWETLSYTTAEAMAMGIKPLIHDFPGALRNWPEELVWQSFADLNRVIRGPYESGEYRRLVEANLDGAQRSEEFSKLLHELAQKPSALVQTVIRDPFSDALATGDFGKLEEAFDVVSPQVDAAGRSAMALQIASLYYEQDFLSRAKYWALQSLCDGPRADAFCLLGEIAVEDDLSTATLWYEFAHDCEDPRSRFVLKDLVQGRTDRTMELIAEVEKFWEVCDAPLPSRFVVVVPVRNGEAWIGRCLESVCDQMTAVPISVVVIDDASTDNTRGAIDEALAKFPIEIQTRVIRNTTRLGALYNTVMGAKTTPTAPRHLNPEDVIVVLDGDDWFAGNALARIAEEYCKGVWATYGSWEDTSGNLSWMWGYSSGVIQNGTYRDVAWAATQPKTFKRWLLDKISETDFKDDQGQWFTIAGDVALMYPILEMARQRARRIPDVLYTYNTESTLNDLKIAPGEQVRIRDLIKRKPRYAKVER